MSRNHRTNTIIGEYYNDEDEEIVRAVGTPRVLPLRKRKGILGFGVVVDAFVAFLVLFAVIFGVIAGLGAFDNGSSKEKTNGVVNENASNGNDDSEDLVPTPAVPTPATCTFDDIDALDLRGDGSLMMKNYINLAEQTVSIQLDYKSEGWLGFAFTEQAIMVPNIATIGLPDDTVQKYFLESRSLPGVNPLEESSQSLINASIRQVDGQTTMEFTRKLIEDGEVDVKIDEPNRFNWAIGSSNTLAIHLDKGSVLLRFNTCSGKETPVQEPPIQPPVPGDENYPSYSPSYSPNDDRNQTDTPSYSPSYAPAYDGKQTDSPSWAPSSYRAATDAPSYTPTWAPVAVDISKPPSYSPTYKPTYAPTYKPTNAPTYYVSKEGTWSKRGNRRSCSLSACPTAPWTGGPYADNGAKCENGLDTSYWNDTRPTYYEYFPDITLQPTNTYNVWKIEGMGKELPVGWGGDFASGSDCFDDPLRGGFRVDLSGTEYWFTQQAWVRVNGWSPAMKMVADGKDAGEWRQYGAAGEYTMYIPPGTKIVEVYCGGWPATCTSGLLVTRPSNPVPAPVSTPGY
jgi:DOMON domain